MITIGQPELEYLVNMYFWFDYINMILTYREPEENYMSVKAVVDTLLESEQLPENLTQYKNKLNLLHRVEAERIHATIR